MTEVKEATQQVEAYLDGTVIIELLENQMAKMTNCDSSLGLRHLLFLCQSYVRGKNINWLWYPSILSSLINGNVVIKRLLKNSFISADKVARKTIERIQILLEYGAQAYRENSFQVRCYNYNLYVYYNNLKLYVVS